MRNRNSLKKKFGVMNSILLAILLFYSATMVILLLWGVSTSLKTADEWYSDKLWLPDGLPWTWGWSNFATVFSHFSIEITLNNGSKALVLMEGLIFNSVFYAVGSAIVITAAYCITAYCVSKFNYVFSKIVYTFVLITMVTPIIGSTPSTLLLLKNLGIYDTWTGNFITKFNFMGIYFLVMHASFRSVSKEYREAALIDGANEYQIFFRIMTPMVMPVCYTIFLIKFIEFWNDYQTPLLFMPKHPTVAYGVFALSRSNKQDMSSEPIRLASCVILAFPIIVIFTLFRNRIFGNVSMGGVKE